MSSVSSSTPPPVAPPTPAQVGDPNGTTALPAAEGYSNKIAVGNPSGMKSMSDYVIPKSSIVAERDTTASMTDIMSLPLGGQVISDKEQNRWLQSYMVGMQDKALDVNLQKESKLVDLDAQIKLKQMALHEKQIDADTLNKYTRAESARALNDVITNPDKYSKKDIEKIKAAVALQRSADGADIKTTSNTNFTQNSHLNEDTSNQNFNGNQQQSMTGIQDINASLNGNLSGVPLGLGMGGLGLGINPSATTPSLSGVLPTLPVGTVPTSPNVPTPTAPKGLINSSLFDVPNGAIKVGA